MVLRILTFFLFISAASSQKLINKIEIEGNVAFSDNRIKNILFSEEGKELLTYKLDRDKRLIENLYKVNGYIEVEVVYITRPFTVDDNTQIDDVVITIKENFQSKFGTLTIIGNKAFSTDTLTRFYTAEEGQPYSVDRIKFFLEEIREFYKTSGYPNVKLGLDQPSRNDNKFIKDIIIKVQENNVVYFRDAVIKGPIDSIPLVTEEALILREMEFSKGEKYDESKVRLTQKYLYEMNLFQNVSISFDLLKGETIDSMDVVIELTERKPSYVGISAGITTDYGLSSYSLSNSDGFFEQFTYEANFDAGKRNWRGTGAEIGLGVNPVWYFASDEAQAAEFTNFSNKFRVYSNFLNFPFHRWQSFIEMSTLRITHPDLGNFDRFNTNYRATRKLDNLGPRSFIDFTFNNDNNDITQGSLDLDANDRRRLGITDNNVFSFGISLRVDERNDQINPKNGYNLLSSIKASVTSGLEKNAEDVTYYTAQLEWRRYQPLFKDALNRKLTLATNMKGGVIFSGDKSSENFELIPIFERFYMGNSVRGFKYNEFGEMIVSVDTLGANKFQTDYNAKGGRIIFLTNIELRYQLTKIFDNDFYVQSFVDIGALWEEFNEMKLESLRMSYGFGASYYLKVLILRLDYGFIHDPRRLNVSNRNDLPPNTRPRKEDQGLRGEYSFGISFHF